MSERAPLLGSSNAQRAQEHNIFLRFCHSPWEFIGQSTLLFLRSALLGYTATIWITRLVTDIVKGNGALFAFDVGNVSLLMQVIYYFITSMWCAQHLQSPRNRPQSDPTAIRNMSERVYSIMSIPRTTDFTENQRLAWSVFYTASVTFPFVVTFLYWSVLESSEIHASKSLNGDPLHDWLVYSIYAVNSMIAAGEIVLLSSVRQVTPFPGHCINLAALTGIYFVWTRIGHTITGKWIYEQVDVETHTFNEIFVNVVTAEALTLGMLLVSLGLHELRGYGTDMTEQDG